MGIRAVPEGWRSQYERMHRSFARLHGTQNDSNAYDDDLYHFFQDAWHLKDWIRNDPETGPSVGHLVETELNKHAALRRAADIANGTKHHLLTTPRDGARVVEKVVNVYIGPDPARVEQVRMLELSDGQQLTAEALASDVLGAWTKVLDALRLSPTVAA